MKGLETFGELKPPVKAAVVIGTGGGLVAALGTLFGPASIPIIAGGLALIAVLFVAYRFGLKWWEKRKASPMERIIRSSASATPTGITEPAKRARLDDLRKNFDSGVEKFRAAGKNLYSLPWYVLVGEPGSGKTEAIRHCNVGFPPGLQDQLQGAGGTVNMNWWFTNHAVILDTAGRLMFEEVEPGTTGEWQEFLKLLKKMRPNCPVNGMLLVIPAESLIRDTADSIERKGGKIAQQLDQIQRSLGVRFPVFVVITKCDLINGFREFFDEVTDPSLQHQILGWSNPATLDTAFNPELVDQHLKSVQERLARRRLALLQDPINTENPSARRTEQVDALYAFPESLMKIAPRLRRYLEMIFVAGEWSAKPLFLRGIYFTSSMREGSALDADLAEALGMDVESLPEGRVWERERAFFLRDLFLTKVFRERGLVTKASNTSAHLKKRRALVYGTGAVGSLILLAFTLFSYRDLSRSVESPAKFWESTGRIYMKEKKVENDTQVFPGEAYFSPLVWVPSKNASYFIYDGANQSDDLKVIATDPKNGAPGRFPIEVQQHAEERIRTPMVFSLWSLIAGGEALNFAATDRQEAAGVLVEESVLRPTIEAARVGLKSDLDNWVEPGNPAEPGSLWPEQATVALAELLRLEVAAVKGVSGSEPVRVGKVLPYIFRVDAAKTSAGTIAEQTERLELATKDAPGLEKVVQWTYDPKGGRREWPPSRLLHSTSAPLLSKGVQRFVASQGSNTATAGMNDVNQLRAALTALEQAESELHKVRAKSESEQPEWWTGGRYADVSAKGAKVRELSAVLRGRPMAKAYDEELENYRKVVERTHRTLLEELAPLMSGEGEEATLAPAVESQAGKDEANDSRVANLLAIHKSLSRSLAQSKRDDLKVTEARAECARFDVLHFRGAGGPEPAYEVRLALYSFADEAFKPAEGEAMVKIGELTARLDKIAEAGKQSETNVENKSKNLYAAPDGAPGAKEAGELFGASKDSAKLAAQLARRQRSSAILDAWIKELTGAPDRIDATTAALTQANSWTTLRPKVPLTLGSNEATINASFEPRAAVAVLKDCDSIAKLIAGDGAKAVLSGDLSERAKALKEAATAYAERYMTYWRQLVTRDLGVRSFTWEELAAFRKGGDATVRSFNRPLNELGMLAASAFEQVQTLAPAGEQGSPATAALGVKGSLTNLTDPTFTTPIDTLFNNWAGLPEDVGAARVTVLASYNDGTLKPAYVWTADKTKDADFIEKFWADFSLKALVSLANAAGGEVPQAVQFLRDRARFPITPYKEGEAALTVDDVIAARAKLKVAQDAANRTDGPAAAPSAARPLPADVQQEVDKLRGVKAINDSDRAIISQFALAMIALPKDATETIKCNIAKDDPAGETSNVGDIWTCMSIAIGGNNPAATRVRGVASVKLVDGVTYPDAGGLSVRYHKVCDDAADPAVSSNIAGPWAPLRLLLDPTALAVRGSGRDWHVKMRVGAEKTVWLKLTFDRDLPDVPTWRGDKK